jgi:OTU domain-containing protein 6
MPKKKARPQRPAAATAPAPAQDDGDGLIDDLLAQLDSRQTSDPSQASSPHRSDPAPPKQSAKSRFLARQARRAAAIAQASPQVDPATQERLQLEINQEEEAIRRTCDQLGLDVFHARILFLRWELAHISTQINPDGHCLFSAVADQLSLLGIISKSQSDYISVRRAAADYIQSHPDDFIPFLPSLGGEDTVMSLSELEQYCASIRNTAEWGGEPEILALSRAYSVAIHVVQGGPPPIVKHELDGTDANTSDRSIAFISYHRRMYGLGEVSDRSVSCNPLDVNATFPQSTTTPYIGRAHRDNVVIQVLQLLSTVSYTCQSRRSSDRKLEPAAFMGCGASTR